MIQRLVSRINRVQPENTYFVIPLSESDSTALYLVGHYDKGNRLVIQTFPEKHFIVQSLHFQGATQGPIFQ
jgi:hypothetical protein